MEEEGDEKEEDSERRRRESGTKEEEPSSEEEEMARRRIGSSSGPAELVAAARAGGPGCPSLVRTLSSGELVLLSRLAPREAETRGGGTLRRCCGRFLTVHKRRRRRITTRCLHEVPALLDDLHHGQVQCVLDKVGLWPFNAFILDTATGGRSLPVLCVHLFHWYGLMDHFSLDVVRIWKFFTLVEEGYHSTNPYHNAIHATDVTQAMHCFLQEEKIRAHLTPLEIMCALIAAVTHDLDHPGVNQPFLIATSNHLAALYENTSVLENHHWRSAIGCLLESQLAEEVASVRPELERQISSLILATDITRQQEFLTRFKKYLSDDDLDMREPDHRHFILQISLKCADISNPCRPWEISRKWSQKVCEEFFRQGDYERQLDLPVTALCDRHTSSVPKIQAGFFRFVVAPLFEEWHKFLRTPLSHSMMRHLRLNQAKWEKLIQDEMAEETRTEISEAEEVSDEASIPGSRGEGGGGEGGGTGGVSGQQRRHSVPASIHRLTVPGSSSSHRRESLPPVPDTRRRMTLGPILQLHADEEVISLLSSPSLGSTDSNSDERPVSAENLLPDVSIASMTSSGNVPPRLLSVPPRLTRQQTFPPLQPYVRQRYLSTAGEILQGSLSTSSGSSSDMESRPSLVPTEKENVDPAAESKTQRSTTKPPSQLSSKQRRGSAPVSSCQYLAPPGGDLAGVGRPLRRGSVPVATATTGGGGGPASCGTAGFLQLPSSPALPPPGSNSSSRQQSAILKPRVSKENSNSDSSSSSERLPTPLPVTLQGGGGGGGGLTEEESRRRGRRCSKKQLRRRSSGGPETFRCLKESSYRRRGSLPIEVLANTLTGRNNNNSVKESMRH